MNYADMILIIKGIKTLFGDELRKERLRSGWTQSELSEKSGISQPLISSFERGRVMPTLDQATMIGGALGNPRITQCYYYFSPYCQTSLKTNFPEIDNDKFPQLEDLVGVLSDKIKAVEYKTMLIKNYSINNLNMMRDKIYINEFRELVKLIREVKQGAVLLDDIADIFKFML